jgi:hypothetical protein
VSETSPAAYGNSPGVLRVGNSSGFYGDRLSAMREMLEGGDLDVLTGDYLAELTMLILLRDRMKDPSLGYAKTFLRQLEDTLGLALEQGVKIVSNAGGMNPEGLAFAVRELAQRIGLEVKVAHVAGDAITDRADELGLGFTMAAHAYLGAFGIAEALQSDADVVVTGRVTDASVVVGPAIAHFGWGRTDYDAIAGAMAAGHVIECGTQATGGNFSFFTEIPDLLRPGFPIAEITGDGGSVITKHAGTGGAVTTETVLSQLLYEVADARYAGPDATLRLDSVRLSDDGPDRVRIDGVRGEAPPPDVKVSCTSLGGYRNEMTFVLTGLDIEAKAELTKRQFEAGLKARPAELTWTLARTDRADAPTEEQASARLTVVARDADEGKVGRAFTGAGIEIALGSYPGCFPTAPPGSGSPYGVYVPGHVPQSVPDHHAVLPDGTRVDIPPPEVTQPLEPLTAGEGLAADAVAGPGLDLSDTRFAPLGLVAGARSGDKGGNANIGVWVRDPAAWPWLESTLTVERLRGLLPEVAELAVTRTTLPALRAVNFVVEGILGLGVAYNARFDPQAKGLAEWLRSRHVEVPTALLPTASLTDTTSNLHLQTEEPTR